MNFQNDKVNAGAAGPTGTAKRLGCRRIREAWTAAFEQGDRRGGGDRRAVVPDTSTTPYNKAEDQGRREAGRDGGRRTTILASCLQGRSPARRPTACRPPASSAYRHAKGPDYRWRRRRRLLGTFELFWKRAGASEPATYTPSRSQQQSEVVVASYSGCVKTGDPVEAGPATPRTTTLLRWCRRRRRRSIWTRWLGGETTGMRPAICIRPMAAAGV